MYRATSLNPTSYTGLVASKNSKSEGGHCITIKSHQSPSPSPKTKRFPLPYVSRVYVQALLLLAKMSERWHKIINTVARLASMTANIEEKLICLQSHLFLVLRPPRLWDTSGDEKALGTRCPQKGITKCPCWDCWCENRTSSSELNQKLIIHPDQFIQLNSNLLFWVKKPDCSAGTVLHRLNGQAINVMPSLSFAVTYDLFRSA